jgi:DNA-binding NarL/FixJ family response regulator
MLTAFETDDFVLDALAAGAAGFLLKHISPADLMASIHPGSGGIDAIQPKRPPPSRLASHRALRRTPAAPPPDSRR